MKLAIVQLSDIHIKTAKDAILMRGDAIARAIRAHTSDVRHYIIAANGDLAYSGKKEQFALARDLLEKVEVGIQDGRDIEVSRVTAPGNHDCDFENEGDVRPSLLNSVLDRLDDLDFSGETVAQMTQVQAAYFEFAEQYASLPFASGEQRLSFGRTFSIDGKTIRATCYNTAWCSRINELPAQLCFPAKLVRAEEDSRHDLVISLFHHPYNWLEPNNSRLFRGAIEANSDIVVTGHEHVPGAFIKREIITDSGQYYFEGGALVDGSASRSSFLVLTINLEGAEFEATRFDWNGNLYQPRRSENEAFVRNKLACKHRFINNPTFAKSLNDPGVGFSHPHARNEFTLADLYVYPDLTLRPVDQRQSANPQVVRSEKVLDFFSENNRVVITGDQESGKSAMARMLYRDLQQKTGLTPLLLHGDQFTGWRARDLRKAMGKAFEEQYGASHWEDFLQLPSESKLLLIDSWENVKYNPLGQASLIEAASLEFAKIFCFTGDIVNVQILIDPGHQRPVFFDFAQCTIRELGRRLRGELIQKWHLLGREYTLQPQDLNHEVAISESKVDTLLGRNLLPAHPIVLLSLLQLDSSSTTAPNAGSYGHIYEAFLTKKLAEVSGKPTDIGTKYTYCSRIAYHLFKGEKVSLTPEALHDLHTTYCDKFQIRLNEKEILDQLVEAKVLVRENDEFRFKFSYCYYYFVAKYFQENLTTQPKLREELMDISDKVNFDDYSQIIVFYLYLTNDQIIIDHLVTEAQRVYAGQEPAALNDDVGFVNRLMTEPAKALSLPSIDIQANREEYRERQDEDEGLQQHWQRNWAKVAYDESLDELTKVNIALKYIRILGQVLRNFPGVLPGDHKDSTSQGDLLARPAAIRKAPCSDADELGGAAQLFCRAHSCPRGHRVYKGTRAVGR
jgi:hypothetical protein